LALLEPGNLGFAACLTIGIRLNLGGAPALELLEVLVDGTELSLDTSMKKLYIRHEN